MGAPPRWVVALALVAGAVAVPPGAAEVPERAHVVAPLAGPARPAAAAAPPPLARRVRFGAYVDGATDDPARLAAFERMVGRPVAVVSQYRGFGDLFPVPSDLALADAPGGGPRTLLFSWDMGPTRFRDWAGGRFDDYLDRVAETLRSTSAPVYVRPWPEMNGDWQTFQPTLHGDRAHGGTYAEFRAAWRHVVDRIRGAGVTNVRWVFNPTVDTYAGTTPVRRIWPGRRYVDVLGLDGFNWGQDDGWGRWRSFRATFAEQYRRLTRLDPHDPVWICEVASKEPRSDDGAPRDPRHSKAAWVRSMLAERGFARVEALVWFQERKERDWRINSSRGSLLALRRALAGPAGAPSPRPRG
ncbi:glycoside hydrolase family 26 protein [Nocardioides sp.]|uniref:glycoside hydrolase family 26 protein n=1 Tax=Nocardioides sp. TaxID=35761 RepID=UPI003519CD85